MHRRLIVSAFVAWVSFGEPIEAQQPRPVVIQSVPVGSRPVGIAFIEPYLITANSGSNSVSIVELALGGPGQIVFPRAVREVTVIPGPYGLSICPPTTTGGDRTVLVTSPADGSVSFIRMPAGVLLGRVPTGREPYSVYCFSENLRLRAVVSHVADATLAFIDVETMTVTSRVADVPGSRGWRGIAVHFQGLIWVAGTDAGFVTLVDANSGRIAHQLPAPAPTSFIGSQTVISPSTGTLVEFNTVTFQSVRWAGIPNLQDAMLSTGFGDIGTTGNSLVRFRRTDGRLVVDSILADIEGAASMAPFNIYFNPGGPAGVGGVAVASPTLNRFFLIQERPPLSFLAASATDFRDTAPGGLASVFGEFGVRENFAAESLPLPATLGGVRLQVGGSVRFENGRQVYSAEGSNLAGLLFVGPRQINFQVPPQTPVSGEVLAQIERADGSTFLGRVRMGAVSPGIFTALATGQGLAAALNQDNSVNVGTRPATRGSVIQLFATGAGDTAPLLGSGEPAPASGTSLVRTLIQPSVSIGGRPARVLFSGLAPGFVGLWQINAEIPRDVDLSQLFVPVTITAGGVTSNTAMIAVQ